MPARLRRLSSWRWDDSHFDPKLRLWPVRSHVCNQSSSCFQKEQISVLRNRPWFRKWQCFFRVTDDAYIKKKLSDPNYYLAWMRIVVVKMKIGLTKTFRKNICALYLDESEFWPISESVHWILKARSLHLITNLTNFSFVRYSLGGGSGGKRQQLAANLNPF